MKNIIKNTFVFFWVIFLLFSSINAISFLYVVCFPKIAYQGADDLHGAIISPTAPEGIKILTSTYGSEDGKEILDAINTCPPLLSIQSSITSYHQ